MLIGLHVSYAHYGWKKDRAGFNTCTYTSGLIIDLFQNPDSRLAGNPHTQNFIRTKYMDTE
jgi:hypothetical protein